MLILLPLAHRLTREREELGKVATIRTDSTQQATIS